MRSTSSVAILIMSGIALAFIISLTIQVIGFNNMVSGILSFIIIGGSVYFIREFILRISRFPTRKIPSGAYLVFFASFFVSAVMINFVL
ncbi:hypothetical protein [Halalkalibacillus halophilus]|uniref:hypothetical protein n=1 Tax=Halalkalibacillus halophilus TaxID=392827 RepID=UPI0004844AFA|nr:hypothetical protein [Halalkalibacillus halophilus]